MSERDFNAFNSLSELREMLGKYSDEHYMSTYCEETYILDILLFLGKSIDPETFSGNDGGAKAYNRFVARKVFPLAEKINQSEKHRFKRELSDG